MEEAKGNEMDAISVEEYLRRRKMLREQEEDSGEQPEIYSSLSMLSVFSASSLCVTL